VRGRKTSGISRRLFRKLNNSLSGPIQVFQRIRDFALDFLNESNAKVRQLLWQRTLPDIWTKYLLSAAYPNDDNECLPTSRITRHIPGSAGNITPRVSRPGRHVPYYPSLHH